MQLTRTQHLRGTSSIALEFIAAAENEAQKITGLLLENSDYRHFRCLQLDIAALAELYFF
jgi:hypothetical protein